MKFSYLNIVFVLALAIVGFAATADKAYAWCEWQDTFWGWTEVCYPDPPPEPPPPPPPPPPPQPPYTPPPTYNPSTGCPAFQPIGGNGSGGFGTPLSYEEAYAYVNAANGSGCGGSCTLTDTHWGYTMVCTPPPVHTTCYSGANACGQTNAGTSVNGGACSAPTPGNPPGLGGACTSPANACGQTTTGTMGCGGCSAAAPANPGNYGQSCTLTSPANACGQTATATGTYNCSGVCVGSAPATPSNASCSVSADLVAGSVNPTAAQKDAAVTLFATISNTASSFGSTGSGFTDSFQINKGSIPASFADIDAIRTYASAALAGGTSNTASASYTFPTAGTWYVRACADLDGSNAGTITEASEANNCGGWTAITVSDPTCYLDGTCPSALSCSFTYSDSNGNGAINTGEPVTFTASPSGLGTYTWDPSESGADISDDATLSGHTYSGGGTFQMRVTASGYNSGICSATVYACAPTPQGRISSNTNRVKTGGTVTLTWADIGGVRTSCSLTGTNGDSYTISTPPDGACSVSSGSRTSATISARTTYNLVCDGVTVDSEIIDIIPKIEEF